MDKDLRVRLITRQIRMKKAFALAAIILSFSNISADELFINCETTSAREAVKEGKIKKPIATYKEVPKYPNAALFKGLEGRVVLGYTVNSDGTISDIKDLARTDKVFVAPSIKALKSFKYKPSTTQQTNEATDHKLKHAFTFEIEGSGPNLFYLSEDLRPAFANKFFRTQELSPERAIRNIDKKLAKEMPKIQKAMYHYLRATKTNQLETKNIPSEKNDLEETLKTLQELDELDPNVFSLLQFTVRAMSQIFNKTIEEIRRVSMLQKDILLSMENRHYPREELYQHYIDYGISAYNLSSWCEAYESFDKAIAIAKSKKIQENPNLAKFRDMAKTNLRKD